MAGTFGGIPEPVERRDACISSNSSAKPCASRRRSITYDVSQKLARMFPERAILEGNDCDFVLLDFVRAGKCTLRREESVHGQVVSSWTQDKGVYDTPRNIWYEVEWQDHLFDVVLMTMDDCCLYYWILGDNESLTRRFFQNVCEFDPDLHNEVLVFDGGYWDESAGLFQAIQGSRFDNLILPGTMKEDIRADLERFFASRATLRIPRRPWKRGVLFTGPPGNGKTHTIKALVHVLDKPCLYVKSFESERRIAQTNIRGIFLHARKRAPCLLVLEDLDSLITDENRSFFLNELDGFAANTGIVTIATTNHPEKLDPAIVERPEPVRPQVRIRPSRPRRAAIVHRRLGRLARERPHVSGRGTRATRGADRGVLLRLPQGAVPLRTHGPCLGDGAFDDRGDYRGSGRLAPFADQDRGRRSSGRLSGEQKPLDRPFCISDDLVQRTSRRGADTDFLSPELGIKVRGFER